MLTANAGLALFGEFMQGLGLHRWLAQEMPLPGSGRGYKAVAYVKPLVLMLAGGGRSLEDLRTFKNDAALTALLKLGVLPGTDAFGDWLRRMGAGAGLDRRQIQASRRTVLRCAPVSRHCQQPCRIGGSHPGLVPAARRGIRERHQGIEDRPFDRLGTGFGMERMPCGQFAANAAFFRIGVIAHNLFVLFKHSALGEGWQRHKVATPTRRAPASGAGGVARRLLPQSAAAQ